MGGFLMGVLVNFCSPKKSFPQPNIHLQNEPFPRPNHGDDEQMICPLSINLIWQIQARCIRKSNHITRAGCRSPGTPQNTYLPLP